MIEEQSESKEIVKNLKESIKMRKRCDIKHQELMDEFEREIKDYFIEKYNIRVRVLFFGDTFGIEKRASIHDRDYREHLSFNFNINVLHDFCHAFECDFIDMAGSDRYIFTFRCIDMKKAFL